MRSLTLLFWLALMTASCGPRVLIEPLIGDDPEVLSHVVVSAPDLSEYPPAVVARSFYEALRAGDSAGAWALVSSATQEAFHRHAETHALAADGHALLAASLQTGLPVLGPEGALIRVSTRGWFVAESLSHFRTSLGPTRSVPRPGERVVLYAIDSDERFREVVMVLEEGRWRIAKTALVSEKS